MFFFNYLNLEIELLSFVHFGMITFYLANFLIHPRCFASVGLSWSNYEVNTVRIHIMKLKL